MLLEKRLLLRMEFIVGAPRPKGHFSGAALRLEPVNSGIFV
jgi:hypothetical protein